MATELLPGTRNVFRFPTEERAPPSLELMRDLAPDVRSMDMLAAAYGLELSDADFRDRVDAEASEHIMNSLERQPGPLRTAQLSALLEPVVMAAVDAARASRRAWGAVGEGHRRLARGRQEGGVWIAALEERLRAQELRAAEATIEAHLRAEEAEGVARAVSLARRGEAWTPRSPHADMEALLQGRDCRARGDVRAARHWQLSMRRAPAVTDGAEVFSFSPRHSSAKRWLPGRSTRRRIASCTQHSGATAGRPQREPMSCRWCAAERPPALVPVAEAHIRRHVQAGWPQHAETCEFIREPAEQAVASASDRAKRRKRRWFTQDLDQAMFVAPASGLDPWFLERTPPGLDEYFWHRATGPLPTQPVRYAGSRRRTICTR